MQDVVNSDIQEYERQHLLEKNNSSAYISNEAEYQAEKSHGACLHIWELLCSFCNLQKITASAVIPSHHHMQAQHQNYQTKDILAIGPWDLGSVWIKMNVYNHILAQPVIKGDGGTFSDSVNIKSLIARMSSL